MSRNRFSVDGATIRGSVISGSIMDRSIMTMSSGFRSDYGSMLSGLSTLSLAEISLVSTIAIPVTLNEISNMQRGIYSEKALEFPLTIEKEMNPSQTMQPRTRDRLVSALNIRSRERNEDQKRTIGLYDPLLAEKLPLYRIGVLGHDNVDKTRLAIQVSTHCRSTGLVLTSS